MPKHGSLSQTVAGGWVCVAAVFAQHGGEMMRGPELVTERRRGAARRRREVLLPNLWQRWGDALPSALQQVLADVP